MCQPEVSSAMVEAERNPQGIGHNNKKKKHYQQVKIGSFFAVSCSYSIYVLICMTPWFFPSWQSHKINDDDDDYNSSTTKNSNDDVSSLAHSLVDMAWCSFVLLSTILYASIQSYQSDELWWYETQSYPHLSSHHDNGTPKSKEELDQEALEEPFRTFLSRFVAIPAFKVEVASFFLGMLSIIKCLLRLQYEIHILDEEERYHPLFWITCLIAALYATIVGFGFESIVSVTLSSMGHDRRSHQSTTTQNYHSDEEQLHDDSQVESLLQPLLSMEHSSGVESHHSNISSTNGTSSNDVVVIPDIVGDAQRKANIHDLIQVCYPDLPYFVLAFVFLLLAALAQVLIPRYTGNMLDAIAQYAMDQSTSNHTTTSIHISSPQNNDSIWNVPDFWTNMKKLVIASIFGGLFSGVRGSIFTVVGGRVNVRLRTMLMDSLLAQDIGFFDVTKTGDITSRLSSDTTLVGDQVTLNVNVFLRSLVQAMGVLVFMTMLSWQLTLLAFISVPIITIFSKWYGHYIRSLTKLMQKKLADGNSISEATLGSMSTVRALGTSIFVLCISLIFFFSK
jgi:hypothetical protein